MTTSARHGRRTIAARIGSVGSREELHELLAELAAARGKRWTRTQVLFYLNPSFHALAERYFDGERLRLPDQQPDLPQPIDPVELVTVLDRVDGIAKPRPRRKEPPPDEEREAFREPSVAELLADAESISAATPVGSMLKALAAEIRAVDARAPKRYRLRAGRCTASTAGRFTYSFLWSSDPELLVPGDVQIGAKWYQARVGEQAPGNAKAYELITEEYHGAVIPTATFRVDPTFLLRLTYQQIRTDERISDRAESCAARLLRRPSGEVPRGVVVASSTDGLNGEQRAAVEAASVSDVGYVWGPPGTGKTRSIASLVSALSAKGKRVLIVSPYNVAVDEAVLSVGRSAGLSIEQVVRFGRVGPDVRAAGMHIESHLERRAAQSGLLTLARQLLAALGVRGGKRATTPPGTVRECLDDLGGFLVSGAFERDDPTAMRVSNAITKLRDLFRGSELEVITGASVVGCTIALATASPLVFERMYDHVIVDEASVVRTPEATLMLLKGAAPITFFGDPKQLPPIVIERSPLTDEWLARSPFAMAGVSTPADACGSCVMLEEQHRMAAPIREIVSSLFYAGRLRDGRDVPRDGRLVVVDTSATPAVATNRMVRLSHSKENMVHRGIVADLIRAVLRNEADAKVLVLSPFVAQKRAYRQEPNTSRLSPNIRFETIHSSQGSEQDVVIVDLVLTGGRHGGKSRMLDDSKNVHLANLINVAMSRAKRQLIFVAHRDFMEKAYAGGLIDRVLKAASQTGDEVTVPAELRARRLFEQHF